MARSRASLHADIWRNPDWLARSGNAQRMFMLILSQPKLTLAGCVDLKIDRWALLCADWSRDDINDALTELEDARFVVVDRLTGEVAVRTFARHDIDTPRFNRNIAKGFWSAWEAIESDFLRSEIVHEMPDDTWAKLEEHAPENGQQTRRSERLEPPVRTGRSNGPSGPPDRTSSSTSADRCPSPLPPDRPDDPPDTEPEPDPAAAAAAALTDADRAQRFHQAVDVLVERHLARNPSIAPGPHRRSVTKGKRIDHVATAMTLLADHPGLTAEELADLLEPTVTAASPEDPTVRASSAEMERNAARTRGDACQTCDGAYWLDPELLEDRTWGPARPCPDCNDEARTA